MSMTPPNIPQSTAQGNQPHVTILSGANVLTPEKIVKGGSVQIVNGKIESVTPQVPAQWLLRSEESQFIPLSDQFLLTPGLVDIQLNGALGADFGTSGIPAMQQLLSQLPRFGVTSILATVITSPLMDMVTATNTLEELLHFRRDGFTRLLGFHLEGPFLNPQRRGAHPNDAIITPDEEALALLLSPNVKAMTYAPEQDASGLIARTLATRGILPLLGHTTADKSTLERAYQQGAKGVTHLFNAMPGFTHRQVGTALHVLNHTGLEATFIADGFHIDPEVLQLMKTVKGVDKLTLVSDAMACAGLEEGFKMDFGGQRVTNQGGRAINAEGNLAGSTQLLDSQVRNLLHWGTATVEEAFTMASRNPARLIGEGHRLGALKAGYEADMVLWHQPTMQVIATWVGGRLLWSDPRLATISNQLQEQQSKGGDPNTVRFDSLMSFL
ncbi:MAG: N-acetylglucosamine-6-phosphate deacetylase [Vampirovibrionales bacterium]